MENKAENSKPLVMAGLSGHQPPSRSPLRVVLLEQKTLLPRKLQGFQEPSTRNQGQRPRYIFYYLMCSLFPPTYSVTASTCAIPTVRQVLRGGPQEWEAVPAFQENLLCLEDKCSYRAVRTKRRGGFLPICPSERHPQSFSVTK